MSSKAPVRTCTRCVIGSANGNSEYCAECNTHLDRIIERALDCELDEEDFASELGLTVQALQRRRLRIRKRLARTEAA